MTGPTSPAPPPPTEIKLKQGRRALELTFADGAAGLLSAEYLRVYSPSAEVTGHGGGEGALVLDKHDVAIARIEPVGRYAVRLVFDDGHDTGLYTWPILYDLCQNHDKKWRRYLERLAAIGKRHPEGGNDAP